MPTHPVPSPVLRQTPQTSSRQRSYVSRWFSLACASAEFSAYRGEVEKGNTEAHLHLGVREVEWTSFALSIKLLDQGYLTVLPSSLCGHHCPWS